MRNRNPILKISALLILLMIFIFSCDLLLDGDGDKNGRPQHREGYFYLIDRASTSIIMLDGRLSELGKWNYFPVTKDSSAQGLAFDGDFLWLSVAGDVDSLFQLNITGDSISVYKSFAAPVQKHGTIRDLTFDENGNMWVINSGYTGTSSFPPTIYNIDPSNGSVLSSVVIPYPAPRALTFALGYRDVYGHEYQSGLFLTDVTIDKIIRFDRVFQRFDTVFSAPKPPLGKDYISPIGLTSDGENFWLINASQYSAADHLFKMPYSGKDAFNKFDLPYEYPGAIVWTEANLKTVPEFKLSGIDLDSVSVGLTTDISILGSGLQPGNKLTVDMGADITVNSVSFMRKTKITANITVSNNAVLGSRDIIVTNGSGEVKTLVNGLKLSLPDINKFIWITDRSSDSLYKVRIFDSQVMEKWSLYPIAGSNNIGEPQGLAFDGTNFWLSNGGSGSIFNRRIYKLKTITPGVDLDTLSSFAVPTTDGTVRGMVYYDNAIWLALSGTANTAKIYKLNPATGAKLDSTTTPGIEPRGIAIVEGDLFCNDITTDTVYKYNFTEKTWTNMFSTPAPAGTSSSDKFATGMFYDLSGLWIVNSPATNAVDFIYKVDISDAANAGQIRVTVPSPNKQASSSLTGLVYIHE